MSQDDTRAEVLRDCPSSEVFGGCGTTAKHLHILQVTFIDSETDFLIPGRNSAGSGWDSDCDLPVVILRRFRERSRWPQGMNLVTDQDAHEVSLLIRHSPLISPPSL